MKSFALYKGKLSIYLILVICIVALMLSLKKCSNPLDKEIYYERAGGDTINVAIEISPLSIISFILVLLNTILFSCSSSVCWHPLSWYTFDCMSASNLSQ